MQHLGHAQAHQCLVHFDGTVVAGASDTTSITPNAVSSWRESNTRDVGEGGGLWVRVPFALKGPQALEEWLVGPAKQPRRRYRETLGRRKIVSRRYGRGTLIGTIAIRRAHHARHDRMFRANRLAAHNDAD